MSLWRPFRRRLFAAIWLSSFISGVGGWMYSAASAWLMTSMTSDPWAIAAVQAASTLPMFLFAIPAGAAADILPKRVFLIWGEVAITLTAGIFALIVSLDAATPATLIVFTFLSSAAVAVTIPAWQAATPQLVSKSELRAAITANGVSINLSRALGPALAGLLIANVGMLWPFWINALSNVGVIASLLAWKDRKRRVQVTPRRFTRMMMSGVRHARRNANLLAILTQTAGFFLIASAYWALLPVIVREQLGDGANIFGLLVGLIGLSAFGCAVFIPAVERWLSDSTVVAIGACGTALALVLFAVADRLPLAALGSVVAGASWISVVATLTMATQTSLRDSMRGRGLSVFITVLFGAMSIGSMAWGALAHVLDISSSLFAAAACSLALAVFTCLAKGRRRRTPHAPLSATAEALPH